MTTRRQFLRYAAATGTSLALPVLPQPALAGVVVNDIHSQLNVTEVDRVVEVDSESNLLLIRGSVPGGKNATVEVRSDG